MRVFISIVLLFLGFAGFVAGLSGTDSDDVPMTAAHQTTTFLLGGGLFLTGLALLCVPIYNRLSGAKNTVDMSFADIEVLLQRRHDVLDNMMAIAKRYVNHESGVLVSIAEHRSKTGGESVEDALEDSRVNYGSRVNAAVEAYPELKADAGFARLSTQLEKTEDLIAESRQRFNASVLGYNKLITAFPDVVFAKTFGMKTKNYFQASGGSHNARQFSAVG